MRAIIFTCWILATIISCSKEGSHEPSPVDRQLQTDLQQQLPGKAFRLSAYYASQPVDYYPDDTIGLTTDLWRFVSGWIHDDSTVFSIDKLTIYQNHLTYPADTNPTLTRSWKVQADDKGVWISYVSNEYQPLRYLYESRTDSSLTLSVLRGSVKLISVFKYL